jgi:biotin carboxyl carrier protein
LKQFNNKTHNLKIIQDDFRNESPSPGVYNEVEIATWLVKTDYVEKDQAIAEVDSDNKLPAEASGIITLKAEEGDAVAVGQWLFNDTEAKPEVLISQKVLLQKSLIGCC